MAINKDLLIAPVSFQEFLIDNDGTPMSNGTITCYRDSARTVLKNWYYQTGTPGAYNYVALPNPLTLSASGTVCDANGVDTLPFFYPYDESNESLSQPYYIVIKNESESYQITRANFPFFNVNSGGGGTSVNSSENYLINNVFWRNIGFQNLQSQTQITVCPSQHDGFRYPDIQFMKNNTNGIDSVSFPAFASSLDPILSGDPTPEFYLRHQCSNTPSGESYKFYQFPVSYHIKTLSSIEFTFTIQAIANSGSGDSAKIFIYLYQDLGSGVSAAAPLLVKEFSLSNSWQKYDFQSIFQSDYDVTTSPAGDDAFYVQIGLPLNVPCDISFTKPSIYLSNQAPVNNFQTYDQIDSVISSARTGDIRFSLNSFSPMGWVAANDGTIGSSSSGATTRANIDTWPLYNLIWNSVSDTYAPVTGSRGASSYADFTANKPMALTKMLSRVLGSTGQGSGLSNRALGETVGAESFVMAANQMPNHTHDVSIPYVNFNEGVSTQNTHLVPTAGSGIPRQTFTSTAAGGTDSISLMQPTVFYNAFFKL